MDSRTLQRNNTTAEQVKALGEGQLNPLKGGNPSFSDRYRTALRVSRKLPVTALYQEFLNAYYSSQVVLVTGHTGCGKSTQIPQFVLDDEWTSKHLAVACIQPNRVAAASVAKRVAEEMDVELGQEVGFKHDLVNKTTDMASRLIYMTDERLAQESISQPNFDKYACVIVDEVHGRTRDTDMLMALLKIAVSRRKDLKVVIMSATLDVELFQQYFTNPPVIKVPGRTFEIQVYNLRSATPDYLISALKTILYIHKEMGPGSILVFVPIEDEVEWLCDAIRRETSDITTVPIHETLSEESQAKVFNNAPGRKCVVSTDLGASLTIPGIAYVVDTGIEQDIVFNARIGSEISQQRPISRAAMDQRAGRTGRTQPGICFRLYTKAAEADCLQFTKPTIRTSDCMSLVLHAASLGPLLATDHEAETPAPGLRFNQANPLESQYGPSTAESFLHINKRPMHAGLGWGDYDKYHEWQCRGLHISKDMVAKTTWEKDLTKPMVFSSDKDERSVAIELLHVSLPAESPLTLPEKLRDRATRFDPAFSGRARQPGGRVGRKKSVDPNDGLW